jgi:uncharacterized membrane protein HdeD (DUF308 family)
MSFSDQAPRVNKDRFESFHLKENLMSPDPQLPHADAHFPFSLMEDAAKHWGRLLAVGLVLSAIGLVGIFASTVLTLASVVFFGWLLAFAGAIVLWHAFAAARWTGVLLQAAMGTLNLVVGVMCIAQPVQGAEALTLLIAASLIVQGVFRLTSAFASRMDGRGWLIASALVTLVLGGMILSQWPGAALWVIGLFVGIDLLFYGSWLTSLALALRNSPAART